MVVEMEGALKTTEERATKEQEPQNCAWLLGNPARLLSTQALLLYQMA